MLNIRMHLIFTFLLGVQIAVAVALKICMICTWCCVCKFTLCACVRVSVCVCVYLQYMNHWLPVTREEEEQRRNGEKAEGVQRG